MPSQIRSGIKALARELEEEDEAAAALWSWLPSRAIAEKHHGDYAMEHRPSPADVMKEAALVFSATKYPEGSAPQALAEWNATCPCGETHDSPEET